MSEAFTPSSSNLASWLTSGKLALARHYVEWSVRCPSIAASTAIAAMAQEEIGHAAILRPIREGEMHLPPFGELDPPCLRTPVTSWPAFVATAAAVEATLTAVLEDLAAGSCTVLARRVPKMVLEERYHAQFLGGWIAEIAKRPDAAEALASAAERIAEAIRPWAVSGTGEPALIDAGVLSQPGDRLVGAALETVVGRCRRAAA